MFAFCYACPVVYDYHSVCTFIFWVQFHPPIVCVYVNMIACWTFTSFIDACDVVVDAFVDKDEKKSDVEHDEAAIAEARREAEERRKEKHRKMEEEREKMRQDIRDKVSTHPSDCEGHRMSKKVYNLRHTKLGTLH